MRASSGTTELCYDGLVSRHTGSVFQAADLLSPSEKHDVHKLTDHRGRFAFAWCLQSRCHPSSMHSRHQAVFGTSFGDQMQAQRGSQLSSPCSCPLVGYPWLCLKVVDE